MSIFKRPRVKQVDSVSSGIYIDIVKRPVKHRPVAVAVLRANAKRHKRNEAARQKRAQLKQLNKLSIAIKG